jgi:hypothetical protein
MSEKKQEGRGIVLHSFNWHCYNCCCSVCTGQFCPYKTHIYSLYRFRCADCVQSNGTMSKCLDCDFFVNKHTSCRRFKIKRIWHKQDDIIDKLNAIIEKLDINYKSN